MNERNERNSSSGAPGSAALAEALLPLKIAYDAALYGASQDRSTAATGPCYLRLDLALVGDVPSMNGNHAAFPGVAAPTSRAEIQAMLALYREHGVSTFFVEVSPCAQREAIRAWLREAGLVPFGGAGYPTLLRATSEPATAPACGLRIAPLGADEAWDRMDELRDAIGSGEWAEKLARATAAPHVRGFAAFDGDRLVAAAGLFVGGPVGYLGVTGTRASHRRRGAQGALIAARLQASRDLGLGWCVSETLYALTSSFNNLRRAGFAVAYERELWTPGR